MPPVAFRVTRNVPSALVALVLPFILIRWTLQISLRGGLVLQWQNLVGIDPHHDVSNVIVDLREPVSRAGGNHNNVASLELVRHRVTDGRSAVARPIEFAHRLQSGWPPFFVRNVGARDECGGSIDDMIHLAHEIVFGERIRRRGRELAPIYHADSNIGLADIHRARLLIYKAIFLGALKVRLNLVATYIGRRAVVAGGLLRGKTNRIATAPNRALNTVLRMTLISPTLATTRLDRPW